MRISQSIDSHLICFHIVCDWMLQTLIKQIILVWWLSDDFSRNMHKNATGNANRVLGLLTKRMLTRTERNYTLFYGKVNTWICKCSMAPLSYEGHTKNWPGILSSTICQKRLVNNYIVSSYRDVIVVTTTVTMITNKA